MTTTPDDTRQPGTPGQDAASEPRLTRRQQQARATRRRIVEAALALFAEQGYAATSTRQIAQAAEVSEGLIFRHFPTKLALLHAVSQQRSTFRHEVQVLLRGASEVPAAVCLRTVGDGFVGLVRAESRLLNVILGESRTNDELYEMFCGIVDGTAGALAEYFRQRIAAGELRPDLPTTGAAQSFLGALFLFFLTRKHLADQEWAEQSTTYVTELLDVWLVGALRRADATPDEATPDHATPDHATPDHTEDGGT